MKTNFAVFLGGPWHLHQAALQTYSKYYEVAVERATAQGPWLPNHYPSAYDVPIHACARYVLFQLPDVAHGGYYAVYVFEGTR